MTKSAMTYFVLSAITISASITSAYAYYDEDAGIISKFYYATADDMISTIDYPYYVEVPNMSIKTKTKDTAIVRFCAATNTGGTGSIAVTIALDGENIPFGMGGGGGVQFSATSYSEPHCFSWVLPEIEPGEHTFSVLWRKYGPSMGYMQSRTLTVEGM